MVEPNKDSMFSLILMTTLLSSVKANFFVLKPFGDNNNICRPITESFETMNLINCLLKCDRLHSNALFQDNRCYHVPVECTVRMTNNEAMTYYSDAEFYERVTIEVR